LLMEKKLQIKKKIFNMRMSINEQDRKIKKMKRFTCVLPLHNGSVFGELALEFKQPRAASILAASDSFFLTINREQY